MVLLLGLEVMIGDSEAIEVASGWGWGSPKGFEPVTVDLLPPPPTPPPTIAVSFPSPSSVSSSVSKLERDRVVPDCGGCG